ncbi:MAG: hypothetical protein ACR2QM_10940 [Longimicrobiales bacterium]
MLKDGVRQCPRCGVQGYGIPYFKRGSHIGLLVGLSVFTQGIGGIVYYLSRRKHLICSGCGLGFEHARPPGTGATNQMVPMGAGQNAPAKQLPPSGIGRRVMGSAMAILGTILITAGIVAFEAAPIAVGSVIGLVGSTTFWWGWKALQDRKQAVIQGLNRQVLLLATERKGVLTVTDVAASLNLSLPAAEKILQGLDDGFRVRSDISREGVLYYEFPEVLHQQRLQAPDPA